MDCVLRSQVVCRITVCGAASTDIQVPFTSATHIATTGVTWRP